MKICSDTLIPIEEHFRVSAGPGAGKTYWLVKHIENVLQNSTRLSTGRKIACISYTNIGVETILKQLGTSSDQVEVSTIHSFLYRHVLKPYCTFVSDEYKLNVEKLSGHDETFVDYGKVYKWVKNHPRVDELKHPYTCTQLTKFPPKRAALKNWLESLYYKLDKNNNLKIMGKENKASYYDERGKGETLRRECLEILGSDLLGYKKLYWEEGIIDHDDVLFFSYHLIAQNPFILTVLRAKFPYFFIDEFQDSNPIQVELIRRIGEEETVVGIIGDRAQSIYGFQEARPEQFSGFSLPGIKDYTMEDNRRSTKLIIDVLNHVREDIKQNKHRKFEGYKPSIVVGDCKKAYRKAKISCKDEPLYSLSRKNNLSNAMKKEFEDVKIDENILEQFQELDGSRKRGWKILSCMQAVELARCEQYEKAMKKLRFLEQNEDNQLEDRKKIVNSLYILLNEYDSYKDESLIVFYDLVKENIDSSLSGFREGSKPYTFYTTNKYKELAVCVNNEDEISYHKTIHKAKGNEFQNVMLILTEERFLDFIIEPNLTSNEEHRVYYVAISRAMDRLFINVPSLSDERAEALEDQFSIEYI